MTKKEESVLGFANPVNSGGISFGQGLIPHHSGQISTQDEQEINEEAAKQNLIMAWGEIQAQMAIGHMAEIEKHAAMAFDETTRFILDIKNDQRSQEHQAYVNEFSKLAIQSFAGHCRAVVAVSASNIASEVNRSLYPTPKLPEPRSLLERIFG